MKVMKTATATLITLISITIASATETYFGRDRFTGMAQVFDGLFPIEYFDFTVTMEVEPFQSMRFVNATLYMSGPTFFEYPNFDGNITLEISDYYTEWTTPVELNLDPAWGGVFEAERFYGLQYSEYARITGEYNEYDFHEDLSGWERAYLGWRTGVNMYIDPSTDHFDFRMTTTGTGSQIGYINPPYGAMQIRINETNMSGDVYNLQVNRLTAGDADGDGDVDITDFNTLSSHFGQASNEPSMWRHGNFDYDNDVDITDFNYLSSNFAPDGYNSSAIPEPSTMLLASLAAILLGVSFRLSKNG